MSADVLENTRPAVIDRRYNAIFSHVQRNVCRARATRETVAIPLVDLA
jgi:hypothetical protein